MGSQSPGAWGWPPEAGVILSPTWEADRPGPVSEPHQEAPILWATKGRENTRESERERENTEPSGAYLNSLQPNAPDSVSPPAHATQTTRHISKTWLSPYPSCTSPSLSVVPRSTAQCPWPQFAGSVFCPVASVSTPVLSTWPEDQEGAYVHHTSTMSHPPHTSPPQLLPCTPETPQLEPSGWHWGERGPKHRSWSVQLSQLPGSAETLTSSSVLFFHQFLHIHTERERASPLAFEEGREGRKVRRKQ